MELSDTAYGLCTADTDCAQCVRTAHTAREVSEAHSEGASMDSVRRKQLRLGTESEGDLCSVRVF